MNRSLTVWCIRELHRMRVITRESGYPSVPFQRSPPETTKYEIQQAAAHRYIYVIKVLILQMVNEHII